VVAEIVIALLVYGGLGPIQEIRLLALRLLGEEVIGKADGERPGLAELADDLIILRKILEAAAGVDGAGDAEAIELAHEVARRAALVVERQLWAAGQRGVEDRGIGLGEQKS